MQLQNLLKVCFPEVDGQTNFSDQSILWKFDKAAQQISTCGLSASELLTFYGVIPRTYSCFGVQVEIGLVVDVMTSPSHRRKGLFLESSLAALERLKSSKTAGVIGFPIRDEVMPGHLKAGWKTQFELPIYVLPVGRSKSNNFRKILLNTSAIVFEFSTRPLRGSILRNRKNLLLASISVDNLVNFYSSQNYDKYIVLAKSNDFLDWRLQRPEITYEIFSCQSQKTHAIAITRQIVLEGIKTLAILDFESDSQLHSRHLIRHLVHFSIENQIEVIAFTTNKGNAKRLKILTFGFLKSHKKFKVITRNISNVANVFTTSDQSNFRITWLDSDTI